VPEEMRCVFMVVTGDETCVYVHQNSKTIWIVFSTGASSLVILHHNIQIILNADELVDTLHDTNSVALVSGEKLVTRAQKLNDGCVGF
jgi:hypothetical protein